MAKVMKIEIVVHYDDGVTAPDESELYDNVVKCIDGAKFLSDVNLECIIDTYDVKVSCVEA